MAGTTINQTLLLEYIVLMILMIIDWWSLLLPYLSRSLNGDIEVNFNWLIDVMILIVLVFVFIIIVIVINVNDDLFIHAISFMFDNIIVATLLIIANYLFLGMMSPHILLLELSLFVY